MYEVVERRTEVAKHWRMDDGSYQAVISSVPVHYQDSNGVWQNLYTDIIDPVAIALPKQPINNTQHNNGGWAHSNHFTTPYNKADLRLPKNIKSGYSIGFGPDKLTFTPVKASPSLGQINPNNPGEIDYQDAWVDTDLTLTTLPRGVKETIILKSNNSPTTFSFKVDGPLASDFTSGSLKIQSPWFQDANGTLKDATMTQRVQGTDTFIDISIDTTGMAFPITLDPSTNIWDNSGTGQDATVYQGNATGALGTQSYLYVGANVYNEYRSLVQFDVSSLNGFAISTGTFLLYFDSGQDFLSGNMTLQPYVVTSSWSESTVTWNTQPSFSSSAASGGWTNTPNNNNGYFQCDVTGTLRNWVNGSTPNYGFICKGTQGVGYTGYRSKEGGGSTYGPELAISYTQPPGAPTVTAPNGGETINTTYNITWNPATDPDTPQSSLTYQIDLSEDNDSTWTTIVSQTAAGATSYNYDFTNTPASSTCLIRIRAYDGTSYGPYDQSNGVFTIQHNQAPTAPTNLQPSGGTPEDRASVIRLSWQFSDPNTGDSQSKFDLQYSTDGGTTFATVTEATPNQYYDVPANTFPHGNVAWKVRAYDQSNVDGPYSNQVVFLAGDKPADPTITSPTSGSTVTVANPLLQWSSSSQTDYQIQALYGTDTVIWDSGDVVSTNKTATVEANLQNNTSYTIQLRIKNSDGLWSNWVQSNMAVSYTPPVNPTASSAVNKDSASVTVNYSNPTGTTAPSYARVYKQVNGAWKLYADQQALNSSYTNYAIESGQSVTHGVSTMGTNGVESDIVATEVTPSFPGVWLHDPADPPGTIYHFRLREQNRTAQTSYGQTMMHFEGRALPIADISGQSDQQVQVTIDCLDSSNDLTTLRSLIARQATLLYRDSKGRKMYGVVSAVPESEQPWGTQVQLTVNAVDYQEGV
jgi:hypothetical protein